MKLTRRTKKMNNNALRFFLILLFPISIGIQALTYTLFYNCALFPIANQFEYNLPEIPGTIFFILAVGLSMISPVKYNEKLSEMESIKRMFSAILTKCVWIVIFMCINLLYIAGK